MAVGIIECYFDYASPFAYLASEQLFEIADKHGTTVDWKPIQLRKLSTFEGGEPYSPSKRKYIARESQRSALFYGLPIQPPHPNPVRSELALRIALVCKEAGIFREFHREVFEAAWATQRDISEPEVLAYCIEAAGGKPDAMLATAKASAVKARLMAIQLDAESKGIFGVPTMIVDNEVFWGVDQLRILDWYLAESKRKRERERQSLLRRSA